MHEHEREEHVVHVGLCVGGARADGAGGVGRGDDAVCDCGAEGVCGWADVGLEDAGVHLAEDVAEGFGVVGHGEGEF